MFVLLYDSLIMCSCVPANGLPFQINPSMEAEYELGFCVSIPLPIRRAIREPRWCQIKLKTNKNHLGCGSSFILSLASMPGYHILEYFLVKSCLRADLLRRLGTLLRTMLLTDKFFEAIFDSFQKQSIYTVLAIAECSIYSQYYGVWEVGFVGNIKIPLSVMLAQSIRESEDRLHPTNGAYL